MALRSSSGLVIDFPPAYLFFVNGHQIVGVLVMEHTNKVGGINEGSDSKI